MTKLQEQKYHAAIQAILGYKPLKVNAHVYLVDNGDVWLRFTPEPETIVDGYRLHLLLTILKEKGTTMIRTNDRAYPFEYDKEWRVWRPDRCPHHFGHYKTEAAAQRSADRINAALGIGKEPSNGYQASKV